jgi:hypothetical protein
MALRRDEKYPGKPGSTRDRYMAKKSKRSIHRQKGLALPRFLEQQVSRAQQQLFKGDFPGTINTCDLLIAHQDQVEEQIALYGASSHPEITSNDYHVIGTLDRPEWIKGIQDPLSMQEMVEHLHDFKEVVTFQRAYV